MQYPIDEIIYPNRNNYGTNNTNSNNEYINQRRLSKKVNRLIHKAATKKTRENMKIGAITKNMYNTQYNLYTQNLQDKQPELEFGNNYEYIKHKEAERGREKVRKNTIKAQLRHNKRQARKIRRETKNNETRKTMNEYLKLAKHR